MEGREGQGEVKELRGGTPPLFLLTFLLALAWAPCQSIITGLNIRLMRPSTGYKEAIKSVDGAFLERSINDC